MCIDYWAIVSVFVGVVKQRFSDFVVNEIDLKGETVRLTSTSTAECNAEANKEPESKSSAESSESCPIPEEALVSSLEIPQL